MRSIKIILLVFLIASVSVSAQKKHPVQQAELVFENTRYDFGELPVGSPAHCEFKFRNAGKATLVLNSVRASCGCTTPEWSKAPIPAGKTGVIKVKYNTHIPGTFLKTITVISNARNEMVVLSIRGKVTLK